VHLRVTTLRDQLASPARTVLLLLAATAVVFVMACGNVANLILARSVRREAELAIRAALGAGRGALRRTLLAESLLLCGAGRRARPGARGAAHGTGGTPRRAVLGARARRDRQWRRALGWARGSRSGRHTGRLRHRVLADALRIALCGMVADLVGAYLIVRIVERLVRPLPLPGALLLSAAAAVLFVATVAASLLPASRGSRIDVIQALRSE
jgi:hypothetical protein